jgi:energy-converting hydrogenase Eha subunit B
VEFLYGILCRSHDFLYHFVQVDFKVGFPETHGCLRKEMVEKHVFSSTGDIDEFLGYIANNTFCSLAKSRILSASSSVSPP